jgi:plasmid stabilization system protein ParE
VDYEIVWSEGSLTDLEEITTYLAQQSPAAAERTATAIHDWVSLLRVTPHAGAFYPPGTTGTVRAVVSGKYRIFYRVEDDEERVTILTVRHTSRRPPELTE